MIYQVIIVVLAMVLVIFLLLFWRLLLCVKKLSVKSYWLERRYNLINKWILLSDQKVNIGKYLSDKKISSVAVYGLGALGKHLISDLEVGNDVKVSYGIDRNKKVTSSVKVYSIGEELPEVDLIIVTPVFSYFEIADELREKVNCPIVALDVFLSEILEDM